MPLRDRAEAGRQLAEKLKVYAGRPNVIVLALPRGGVPVAYEVATALRAPLDVLVVRRLAALSNHDMTIGAVAGGGISVIDDELCRTLNLLPELVREIASREQAEVERRQRLYRACCEPLDVRQRTVILVDDGMATGASMRAAVIAIAERQPAAIVVAVPVASYATCAWISGKVREIVYCFIRDPIYSVGLWYEKYPQVSDEEACQLLRQANTPASHDGAEQSLIAKP
jgi:putative phosphoribosyl transferase